MFPRLKDFAEEYDLLMKYQKIQQEKFYEENLGT